MSLTGKIFYNNIENWAIRLLNNISVKLMNLKEIKLSEETKQDQQIEYVETLSIA